MFLKPSTEEMGMTAVGTSSLYSLLRDFLPLHLRENKQARLAHGSFSSCGWAPAFWRVGFGYTKGYILVLV